MHEQSEAELLISAFASGIESFEGRYRVKSLILALTMSFALFLGASAFSIGVDPGEFGVLYNCGYPVTVVLDGDFADWPANVPWHKVTHDMGWNTPEDDDDGSYEFACVADNRYLYVAIKIWDDKEVTGETAGHDVYKDDCVELYIDGDNSKAGNYDGNDSQIMIGRDNLGGDPKKPSLGGANPAWGAHVANAKPGPDSGAETAVVNTKYGWAMEVAVPLAEFDIRLADGTVIGFNVQLNDDDDGGDRDHKQSWSKAELDSGVEGAYRDTSVWGELRFVETSFAVSSQGKLAATWALIKQK